MAMVVKNNMTAINTLNTLNKNTSALSKSLQKVSSGMKINSAADDASGYAISERMRVQIRSLDQANQNTQNGSSMMKVAEGAVSSTVEILKTLKEKAVNAANDSNTDSDRQTIQKELDQSIDQINDNANVTFNGKYLVDGSKNSKGNATYTVLTNQSLGKETTATTQLKNLTSRSGDSLEIETTDSITVSYVVGGKTQTTSFKVENKTLQDIFTAAEALEPDTQLFADITNQSVMASKSLPDYETAKNEIARAESALFGTVDATHTTLTDKIDNAKDGSDADNFMDAAKVSTDAGSLAHAIAVYNNSVADDDKIDTTKLTTWMTVNSTDSKTQNNSVAPTAKTTELAKMMETLKSDKNYSKLLASEEVANGTDNTVKKAVSAIDTAYTTYTRSLQAYYNAHITVVDSEIVGVDANGDTVTTASGEKGISITAAASGISGQISGFTISVSDSKGNVKKSANAALDAFSETIRAQNKSEDNSITLQVGASANQSIKVGLTDMRSEALGLKGADGTTLNISTQSKANAAINVLDNAIQKALDQQTTIGSVESRLEYTASNLTTASENVQSSESTIRDADMAKEMTEYTKNNVLMQAAQSMLAQANQSSSNVLSLLQ